jgi:hypothetical protein
MASTVSRSRTTVGLSTLPVLERLTAEGTLIDFALLGTRKWHTEVFKLEGNVVTIYTLRKGGRKSGAAHLNDCPRGLTGHIMNCVLVAEPIRTFDL